jgi:HEPN domain-containing protein
MDVLVRTPKQVTQAIESGNSFLKYEVLGKGKVLYEKNDQEQYENLTSDNFEQAPPKYYERLLFYAQADLETAERSVREETRFYHKPCFDARGCVEKSLKAFIEAAGKISPPVHGLITLLRECGAIDKSFLQFRWECNIFNRYIFDARYPAEIEDYDFTTDTAIEAVTIAREIFDFVKEKIQRRKEIT